MIWGLAQCNPIAYQWDKSIEGGWCADPQIYMRYGLVVYAYSTVLDVFFALYPVPFVMRLNMPLSVRLGVAISLSLSLGGFAISVYKFTVFPDVASILPTDPSCKFTDYYWWITYGFFRLLTKFQDPMVFLAMTHAAEGSFLIISTSLATLRPLYRGIKQQVVDRSFQSSFTRRPLSTIKCNPSGSDTGREEGSDNKRSSRGFLSLLDMLDRTANGESELDLGLHLSNVESPTSAVSSPTKETCVDDKC